MKKAFNYAALFLLSPAICALTISNQHKHKVKFEIQLHIDDEATNYIYKSLGHSVVVDMRHLFSEPSYPGSLFSIIVYDYDYSRTRVVCVNKRKRDDNLKVTYLGYGKCEVR
jgi:hypothetical protein